MNPAESINQRIHNEFGSVPFPSHCGLHAAVAMDDWISDEAILREITQREDCVGEWWEVPEQDLLKCMMALSYLDSAGIEFYLPAYMTAILENPEAFDQRGVRSSSWQIIFEMIPDDDADAELNEYFQTRFSRIRGGKWRVCRTFLEYIAGCNTYDRRASELAKEALAHEFWKSER